MSVKIATVGDNCMDVYENIGKAYPGGNPVNVAVYFVRMGGEASYVGLVGTDAYGEMMVKAIGEKGVDVSHVRAVEGTTAITHVELINGDRIMGDYEEGVLADFKLTEEEVDFLGFLPFQTFSKNVSGLFLLSISDAHMTVTRSSVSLRLMILCVQPGFIHTP